MIRTFGDLVLYSSKRSRGPRAYTVNIGKLERSQYGRLKLGVDLCKLKR